MKVYIVKIFNDIENNYQGIDDTEITVCKDKSTAQSILSNELDDTLAYFKRKYDEEIEDLDYEYPDNHLSFHVNNGKDYISGVIEEKEVL